MKSQDPKGLRAEMAVFPKGTVFFTDVAAVLKSDQALAAHRKRDLMSALRRVSKVLALPMSEIPADRRWLRVHLDRVSPPQLRIARKTCANVRSNVMAALEHAGLGAPPYQNNGLATAWECLKDELPRGNDRGALGRFSQFCSNRGVDPDDVTDADVSAYRAAVDEWSLTKRPDQAIYYVTTSWNRLVDHVPGWPSQRLTVPCRMRRRSVTLDRVPMTFARDLARYLAAAARANAFDQAGRHQALAATTIKSHGYIIRRFLTEQSDSGVDLKDIVDLRAMLTPAMFERGLRQLHERKGNRRSTSQHVNAVTLRGIARHYLQLSEGDLEKMRLICDKLKVVNRTMTDKNRERLRPFDDRQNVGLVLNLPGILLRDAKSGRRSPKRSALLVEIALAIELLVAAALRIKNLAQLHLDNNLQWSRATRQGVCHLVVHRQDVKNGEPLEAELHEDVVKLLRVYVDTYRPLLVQPGSRWLFGTRENHNPVDPVVLARRITTEIRQRTGLTVNVHLFRALVGKLFLDQHPGSYEVLRRLLGHRSITTTIQAYTGMESVANAKHFDETIRRLKNEIRPPTRRRNRAQKGGSDAPKA